METIADIELRIKQEPREESFCDKEVNKSAQNTFPDSSNATNHSNGPASQREENKRKASDDVECPSEKRQRCGSEDVEIFSGDFSRESSLADPNGNLTSPDTSNKCGKFQCLLCDDNFDTEDKLMMHLSLVHKHTSPGRRQTSRFSRHTCQVCYARFRTLKDFFNHTSCHASHPSMSSIDRDMSARVSTNLSKNALQRYFLNVSNFSRDLLQPTFKCDCCNTVFVNRDTYAMHVMMRVKNESCKVTCDESFGEVVNMRANSVNQEDLKSQTSAQTTSSDENNSKSDNCSPTDLHQAFYVDITSSAERDEYLQSVLEKGNNGIDNNQQIASNKLILKDARKCMLCQEMFADQDALAMHVMSRHSNDLSSPTSSTGSSNHYNTNKTPSPTSSHILKYFAPFANDRMLTLQTEILYCEYCGQSFVNRDTLAMHVLSHAHEQETSASLSLKNALHKTEKSFESTDIATLRRLSDNHMKVLKAHNEEPLNLMTTERSRSSIQITQRKESGKENDERNCNPGGYGVPEETKKNKNEKTNKTSVESSRYESSHLDRKNLEKHDTFSTFGISQYFQSSQDRKRPASVPSINAQNVEWSKRAASAGCLIESGNDTLSNSTYSNLLVEKETPCSEMIAGQLSDQDQSRTKENVSAPPDYLKNNNKSHQSIRRTSEGNSLEDLLGFCKHPPPLAVTDVRGCPGALTEIKEPNKIEVMLRGKDIHVCKYCEIIFPSRTLYYLHMGLHNVNTPWQCNMCGKVCANVHDFNAHVIHL